MSALNASLGYFLSVVIFAVLVRIFLRKWLWSGFIMEFASSFMLVACLLEVQTIVEVGEWAVGLGADVAVTILFVVLLTHGGICGNASGNPTLSVLKFLQLEATTVPTLLSLAAQFLGAQLARVAALYYWNLELTDMHMLKNLMTTECSTTLLVSLPQGFFTECVCALAFHLVNLNLQRRSAFIRVPLIAVLLTFLSFSAKGYTSAYINPSLAFGLTFYCPGFTFTEYATVYWLGPLTGMTLALLLYVGNIPRLFSKNLLYFQKTRFKAPKGDKREKKNA
ncbi:aquaporin 12 [Brachionichthys hirsutus]|uniref:aquaporin 12 n=1 Tax=Brachionichthys hirsutus TaxID=412623 RepID=UPI003604FA83